MLYQLSYFRKYTLNFRGGYLTRYYCQIPNKLVIWNSITIMIMPNIFLILKKQTFLNCKPLVILLIWSYGANLKHDPRMVARETSLHIPVETEANTYTSLILQLQTQTYNLQI